LRLVAAMNPCPCVYYGNPVRECKCSSGEISRYQKRLSSSLLDRIVIGRAKARIRSDWAWETGFDYCFKLRENLK
jgi:magnesium chelatase family protein